MRSSCWRVPAAPEKLPAASLVGVAVLIQRTPSVTGLCLGRAWRRPYAGAPHEEPHSMTQLLPMMMYCFVMSITPGPNNLLLTASGANFGFRLTLPQVLGCVMGNVLLTLVACAGLGHLFLLWPAGQ